MPWIAVISMALASCASPTHYFGIPTTEPEPAASLGPDGTLQWDKGASLRSLARSAQLGDKRAQFELAARFEHGIEIERDLGKACRLYAIAARQSGGTIWVYSPPVGNSTRGSVIPIDSGPVIPGLSAARERLNALKNRGDC